MMRKDMILALGCAAALLAACDSTRGDRPIGTGYRSSSDVYSRAATAHGGDTYDDRGVAGSSTSGRATILHQDRPGGSDYDPYGRDVGRSDSGAPSLLHQDRPGGSDSGPDRPRY
jgi:hypothetical protein